MSTRERDGRRGTEVGTGDSQPSSSSGVYGMLVDRMGANGAQRLIQRRRAQQRAAARASTDEVHAAAERGLRGPAQTLPHGETIQRSFGRHDVSHVKAHSDGAAAESAAAMGAEAFASGDEVAFAGAPSLHTAAHEAAHVVQQRGGGVQLKSGVGRAGDEHERHADAVADAVVAGRSAESLLDQKSSAAAATSAPVVQRREIRLSNGDDIETSDLTKGELEDLLAEEEDDDVAAELRAALDEEDWKVRKRKDAPESKEPAKGSGDKGAPKKTGGKDAGSRGVKSRKLSKVGVGRDVGASQKKEGWGFATGHSSSGKWTEEVNVRGAHTFDASRVRQALRHISTMLFHHVKASVKDEQEVQAMLVNDRVLVSSNSKDSMALFSGKIGPEAMFEILLGGGKLPASDERALGDLHKLRALVKGQRIEELSDDEAERGELRAIKEVLLGALRNPAQHVKQCDLGTAPSLIGDSGAAGQLIFVSGLDKAHAEQNLILAYALSGSKSPAHIYGKKRPCTGCYLTFRYATEVLKLPITFNENPGGFWAPALPGLFALLKEKNATAAEAHALIEKHLPEVTHRTQKGRKGGDSDKDRENTKNEQTGYDSASDTETEEVELGRKDVGQYQPNDRQREVLRARELQVRWIEPDGECVFGALGHVIGKDAAAAKAAVLKKLRDGDAATIRVVNDANKDLAKVIGCIESSKWSDADVGDILLEVAAAALGANATVLLSSGATYDLNTGGPILVRVTSPHEHYHATVARQS